MADRRTRPAVDRHWSPDSSAGIRAGRRCSDSVPALVRAIEPRRGRGRERSRTVGVGRLRASASTLSLARASPRRLISEHSRRPGTGGLRGPDQIPDAVLRPRRQRHGDASCRHHSGGRRRNPWPAAWDDWMRSNVPPRSGVIPPRWRTRRLVPFVLQASEFVPQLSGRLPTGRGLFAALGALEGLSESNIAARARNREA